MGPKKSTSAAELPTCGAIRCEKFFNYLASDAAIGHEYGSTYGRLTEPRRMIQSSAPIL